MILVEKGDNLPTVAMVQSVLSQLEPGRHSFQVDVTGYFDAATETVVKLFQRKHGLQEDGIVGPRTWERLRLGRRLRVIDHVDGADDYRDSREYYGYDADLERVGVTPIVSYYQSGGLMVAADRILRACRNGRVVLLRFHGHGGPGSMAVTVGRGVDEEDHAYEYGGSRLSLAGLDWREVADHFQPLRDVFHPLGSVELHGCNVAGELYVHGRRIPGPGGTSTGVYLLQRLAQLWGVPVTASPNPQDSYGRAILRFEGRTVTVCPDGIDNLEEWAASRAAEGRIS